MIKEWSNENAFWWRPSSRSCQVPDLRVVLWHRIRGRRQITMLAPPLSRSRCKQFWSASRRGKKFTKAEALSRIEKAATPTFPVWPRTKGSGEAKRTPEGRWSPFALDYQGNVRPELPRDRGYRDGGSSGRETSLAADVEGYGRLMHGDEEATMVILFARRAVVDELIGRYRGRIANAAGDSARRIHKRARRGALCGRDSRDASKDGGKRTGRRRTSAVSEARPGEPHPFRPHAA
jgi:hypothetical protein